MVNKLTIEEAWKHNPNKVYYVIQNPRIDNKNKRVLGLTVKTVEYIVKDWDKENINFEKVNKDNDKMFPEILVFDKRYPDAENEVFAERVSKAKKKPEVLDSFGIFIDKKLARFHKLVRLHRVAEQMAGVYKSLKEKEQSAITKSENKNDTFQLDDVKNYFQTIQDTNYFEELELIQVEYPDLAVK